MCIEKYLNSSIGRKQIVAATGLLLILFVIGHLAGNLILYLGPEAYNNYAKKLAGLRPFLYFIESGLAAVFVVHMYVTALLVFDNIQARGQGYRIYAAVGERSLATRLMPYTGTLILAFVIWHLMDFTFVDREGPRSLVNGVSLGLYGVVYNSFSDLWHSIFYVLAMFCLGFHLTHGIQSFFQTFGFSNEKNSVAIQKTSDALGFLIALGYSTLPVFIFFNSTCTLR